MGRIMRSRENLFDMPAGAYLRNKIYVYVNTSNKYVSPLNKKNVGTRGYTDHDSVCIGVLANPDNKDSRKFYANTTYRLRFLEELPDPPAYGDSLAVGLRIWTGEAAEQSGLSEDLTYAFKEKAAALILDMADYMMSAGSAVMQHFPAWARDHALFSDVIVDDTAIGKFLKEEITVSKINLFRDRWAMRNIGEGRLYLCYDSTNVNSQAEGVAIVQKGYAKDDPSLCQVNSDYVVRQEDGLPFTYLHSPGSVTDIAQAQEMITFLKRIRKLSGTDAVLCLICDRGYISEKNLKKMDAAGFTYILMLRCNFGIYDELASDAIDKIRTYKNELETEDEDEKYGITVPVNIYEDGPECYAQIIWSNDRYRSERSDVKDRIARERKKLEAFIAESTEKEYREEELKWISPCFKLNCVPGAPQTEERRRRGRGKQTYTVTIPTFKVTGYEDNEQAINREYQKAGIMILITREKLTAQETIEAYAKRDCVEKVFEALKSHLGMDKIGVSTEEAMHGKGLVWFVASILHALMFNKTAQYRLASRKYYTVPAMIDQLEAIKADKDLSSGKRKRRYKLTKKQQNILNSYKITEKDVDNSIANISV